MSLGEGEGIKQKAFLPQWTMNAQQAPITILATGPLTLLRAIGMCPFNVVFDSKIGEFALRSGSKFRKAISLILGVLTLIQSYGASRLHEYCEPTSIILGRVMAVGSMAVSIAFYRVLLTKGSEIQELLNLVQKETVKQQQTSSEFLGRRKARLLSAGLITTATVVSLLHAGGSLVNMRGFELIQDPFTFSKTMVDLEVRIVEAFSGYPPGGLSQDDLPGWLTYGAGGLATILCWLSNMRVSCTILLSVVWAILFVLLLRQFFSNIRKDPPGRINDMIRSFNAIVNIIDKYNRIFAWVTLTSAITYCLFMSGDVSSALTSQHMLGRGYMVGPALWFTLQLVTSAHVHHVASQIVVTIREKFHSDVLEGENISGVGSESVVPTGIMLVLHDIQTGNVGIKGFGFFTCSYAFLASIIGIIGTYAVIMVQFNLGETGPHLCRVGPLANASLGDFTTK